MPTVLLIIVSSLRDWSISYPTVPHSRMRLLALVTLVLVALAVLCAAAPVKKAVKPAVVTTTTKKREKSTLIID